MDESLAAADEALSQATVPSTGGEIVVRPRSVTQVDASLALISTPGRYATAEALKALRHGMSAFLFSDNVPVEQELMLKREAHERGLLVMGPDCGTGIIAGVPLGFANVVRQGDIGLIGASGTGLQEISTLIDGWAPGHPRDRCRQPRPERRDRRDLDDDAIDAFAADPATRVIGLVSKPPDPEVAEKVLAHAVSTGKPVVAAFLGASADGAPDGVIIAATLEEAARQLVKASTGQEPPALDTEDWPSLASGGERRLLRGLFAGGTFAYEATVMLEPHLGPE